MMTTKDQAKMNGNRTFLVFANEKRCDHVRAFKEIRCCNWKSQRTKFSIGDTVYVFINSEHERRVRYKTIVTKVGQRERLDKPYWHENIANDISCLLTLVAEYQATEMDFSDLKEHGLKCIPQGAVIANNRELLEYIETCFQKEELESYSKVLDETSIPDIEGFRQPVFVNKYERSLEARKKCIELKGTKCIICGFDFEETYGDIGRGFIHIHHIIPMSTRSGAYEINYETDLIPVCPNCHAMLHRGKDGYVQSVESIRKMIRSRE